MQLREVRIAGDDQLRLCRLCQRQKHVVLGVRTIRDRLFGFSGVFIGPVIASLFVTIWEIYGVEFADVLPDVEGIMAGLGQASAETAATSKLDPIKDE